MFTDRELAEWLIAERDHVIQASAQQIRSLQTQVVDRAITDVLTAARIERQDVAGLVAAFDATKLIRTDGTVDLEAIESALKPIDPELARQRRMPPRTGVRHHNDNGVGRYLEAG